MAGDTIAPDDYDRACAVDDLAGVIPVGENGAQALVLADKPATSCYLPESRAFLRWLAADSEAGSDLGIEYPGGGMPAEASVPLPAGFWRVRATHTKVDEENWVGLVQLPPTES